MTAAVVAVLGASGVYGRHLVPRLTQAGYRVRALVRSPTSARLSTACGAEIHKADIFDGRSLRAALEGCDVAVNLATALPSPAKIGGDFDLNDRVRREGVPILLKACSEAGVPRIVQQSIAIVHSGYGEALVDENVMPPIAVETIAGRAISAARDMETAITRGSLDWLILRGALFYGPGTGFDDEWFSRASVGKLRLPNLGDDYVSLVHIADMADATVAALMRWPSRQSLIIADDEPSRWRDVFGYVSAAVGGPPPQAGGLTSFPSFRVSNRRARDLLAWAPRYPNYVIGLVR